MVAHHRSHRVSFAIVQQQRSAGSARGDGPEDGSERGATTLGTWEYFSASFAVKRMREIGTPAAPETGDTTIEDLLDEHGELGWELVGVAVAPAAVPEDGPHFRSEN